MADELMGRFFVAVEDVCLEFNSPPVEAEGEKTTATDVVSPPAPPTLKAQVTVDKVAADVWDGSSPVEATCELPASGAVVHASSNFFGLSEAAISNLLDGTVTVTLFQVPVAVEGEAPPEDVQLAALTVPLYDMLATSAPVFTSTLALGEAPPPKPEAVEDEGEGEDKAADDLDAGPLKLSGSTSFVTIKLSCDDDLCDFILGGTVLAVQPATVEQLPAPWTLSPPPDTPQPEHHTKVAEMLQGPEKDTQTFTLAAAEGSALPDLDYGAGQWQYQAPSSAAAPTDEAPVEGDAAAPVFEPGAWTLSFAAPPRRFLTRTSRLNLKAALKETDGTVNLVLTRTGGSIEFPEPGTEAPAKGKGKGKPAAGGAETGWTTSKEEDWAVAAAVNLASLLSPGAVEAAPAATLTSVVSEAYAAAFADNAAAIAGAAEAAAAAAAAAEGEEAPPPDLSPPAPKPMPDRTTSLEDAGTTLVVGMTLSAPLCAAALESGNKPLTMGDVLPPAPAAPKRPPRDYEAELRAELDLMVRTIAEEHACLFPPDVTTDISTEEQKKQLLYTLNTNGVYHQCKEKLKPRIQRLVRAKFERTPTTPDEADRFVSQLYLELMTQLNTALSALFDNAAKTQEPQVASKAKPLPGVVEDEHAKLQELTTELARLKALADDAEANGDIATATQRHEDRTAHANAPAANPPKRPPADDVLQQRTAAAIDSWVAFAWFALRTSKHSKGEDVAQWRAKAAACLVRAVHVAPDNIEAVRLYGCVLLEQGKFENADAVLQQALDVELDPIAPGEERTAASLAAPDPLSNMLRCVHLMRVGKHGDARTLLCAAVTGCVQCAADAEPAELDGFLGKPRRTAVYMATCAAQYLIAAGLTDSAALAFEIADKAEQSVKEKAERRGLPTTMPSPLKQRMSKARAELALVLGDLDTALSQASIATDLNPKDGVAWLVAGDVHHAASRLQEAATAYSQALDLLLSTQSSGSVGSLSERPPSPPPLRLFVRLGALYLQMSAVPAAQDVFLQGCDAWQTCSMWLGVGITLLRLEQWDDAEDALSTANIRNNRSAVVWGYLTLCCLARGDAARVPQANKALVQAERLGLADAHLLRELGNSYESIDLLEKAEALFRRSLACEPSTHTRRRLADVLSAQNSLAAAVEEYKAVLRSSDDKNEVDIALAECEKLLLSLGRTEEIESLRALRTSL